MGMAHILPRFKALPPPGRGVVLATYWLDDGGRRDARFGATHGGVRAMDARRIGAAGTCGAVLFAGVIGRLFWQARARSEPFDRFIIAALARSSRCPRSTHISWSTRRSRASACSTAGDAALLEAAISRLCAVRAGGVAARAAVLPVTTSHAAARRLLRAAVRRAPCVAAARAPQFDATAGPRTLPTSPSFALAAGVVGAVAALRVFEEPASDARRSKRRPPTGPWCARPTRGSSPAPRSTCTGGCARWTAASRRCMPGGAIRHAFLLGFATLMMMAMAYRTVPVFSGRGLRWPSLVPASFALGGRGAVLRCSPWRSPPRRRGSTSS
jgi:hypothetical protein